MFSRTRTWEKLLEQQKASKGELFVQFVYTTAGIASFAYLGALVPTFASGNLKPLTDHPGLTALLCLISGISLANLCRTRSAKFWKIVDLVWIVTFVPSLAMTVILYQQEEVKREFNALLEESINLNILSTEDWRLFSSLHCTGTDDLYVEVCTIIENFVPWLETFAVDKENYLMLVTDHDITKDNLFGFAPRTYFRKFVDRPGHLKQLEKNGKKTIAKINTSLEQLGIHPLSLPETIDTVLLPGDFYWSYKWYHSNISFKYGRNGKEVQQLQKINGLYSTLLDIWNIKLRLEFLMTYYETKVDGIVPNAKFLPLIFACFVFPFRVGKSIFEIAAKKEPKNAPVPS